MSRKRRGVRVGNRYLALSGASATDNGKLIFRMPNPLFELPAVGVGLARLDPLELGTRLLELPLRPVGVDVKRVDGVVDQSQRTIVLDLEEPRPRRELAHLAAAPQVDARRARLEHRDERRVPCEHADLAGVAGHDDLPEQAFYMVGVIEQAVERAKSMAGEEPEAKAEEQGEEADEREPAGTPA